MSKEKKTEPKESKILKTKDNKSLTAIIGMLYRLEKSNNNNNNKPTTTVPIPALLNIDP